MLVAVVYVVVLTVAVFFFHILKMYLYNYQRKLEKQYINAYSLSSILVINVITIPDCSGAIIKMGCCELNRIRKSIVAYSRRANDICIWAIKINHNFCGVTKSYINHLNIIYTTKKAIKVIITIMRQIMDQIVRPHIPETSGD